MSDDKIMKETNMHGQCVRGLLYDRVIGYQVRDNRVRILGLLRITGPISIASGFLTAN